MLEASLISICAPADPALLEPTYTYLSAYCFACLPPQLAQRMNVAIYELYANALRYGTRDALVRFELRRSSNGGAELVISNGVEAAQLLRLAERVTLVTQDPAAAFNQEMNRFDSASHEPAMLGIVRAVHESGVSLSLSYGEGRAELRAVCAP